MKKGSDSMSVVARDDERAEVLIKRFQKLFRNSGLMQELMDRRSYQKPSVRRRRKESRAWARRRAEERNS